MREEIRVGTSCITFHVTAFGIYGLACGYVDYAEGITWFKDPARIAIMNSHVKLAVPWEEPETETTKQSEDAK